MVQEVNFEDLHNAERKISDARLEKISKLEEKLEATKATLKKIATDVLERISQHAKTWFWILTSNRDDPTVKQLLKYLDEGKVDVADFCKRMADDAKTERFLAVWSQSDGGMYIEHRNLELQVSRPEKLWRSSASDYENRYCGHCNATTDIKEANFFGNDGRYIIAGSDDGSIFFWNRFTENNIRILKGDTSIVNCVQPHPAYCLLASSGIDPVVRIWTPMPEEGWLNDRIIENIEFAAEKNHKRMWRNYIVFDNNSEESDESDEPLHPCRPS